MEEGPLTESMKVPSPATYLSHMRCPYKYKQRQWLRQQLSNVCYHKTDSMDNSYRPDRIEDPCPLDSVDLFHLDGIVDSCGWIDSTPMYMTLPGVKSQKHANPQANQSIRQNPTCNACFAKHEKEWKRCSCRVCKERPTTKTNSALRTDRQTDRQIEKEKRSMDYMYSHASSKDEH
ncbi:hypothetical protein T310_9513 [Rasamsonia emersonii CBS 393.64]|uniref:Uncharacterized protein n=1 Tax=Rasamsonia emersonii (strain ATCC 16479 / CBS 393.64 / IMI 116815) TaxID=1408163 RepID=A0A0F4YFG6_RASE3|nr:hypothetical protein T310_9513 [Rasamsonia emersonii CBS 393.64]KKA16899.1 hypothetical protein T310_9513 [Rasamsonia emersonii CBS 393.64]